MKKNQLKCLLAVALLLVCGNVWGETVTDILDNAFTGVSGNGYEEWSGKKSVSTAVYAGNSAGDFNSIQLRSSNSNSGVITTASCGTVKKVTVTWNSGTTSDRTLSVYGKNTAYTNASDLYNTSKQGTLLGTIVYGKSTELVITGEYQYIGFRSKSGAMYLDKVEIVWEKSAMPSTPSISFVTPSAIIRAGETFTQTATVENAEGATVSYSSSNPEIATVDASGKVTGLAKGTVTITGTLTVSEISYSAYYSVTVNAVEDGIFDFMWGYDYGSGLEMSEVAVTEEKTFTSGRVTFTASTNFVWYTDGTFRLYKGGSAVIAVPEGYVITEMVFTGKNMTSGSINGKAFTNGSSNTWTGSAASVTLRREGDNPVQIKTIVVAYEEGVDNRETPTASFSHENVELRYGETQTITVNTNSNGVISYSSSDAAKISVDATTGEIRANAVGSAIITATIDGTNNFKPTTAQYTVTVTTEGSGTETDPYTVADVKALNNTVSGNAWVKGTIKGFATSGTAWITTGDVKNTNIMLGDGKGNVVPVQLQVIFQQALGLLANPQWIGCEVAVFGSLEAYYGVPGMKGTSDFAIAIPAVISAAEWATACLPFDATIATEGVTAYYVSVAEGAIGKTAVTGVIPAGEGVLLNGESGAVTFNYSEASNDDKAAAADNQLVGSLTGETFNEEGKKYYILANGNDGNGGGNGIGFYYQTEGGASATCAQYKAVLAVPAAATESIGYRLDGTTMVEQMLQDDADAVIYDLTGRQVSSISGRGIYIINGKKVIVK